MKKRAKKTKDAATLKAAAESLLSRVSKCRDELRSLLSEYEDVLESCDSACEELEIAVETLSQYV